MADTLAHDTVIEFEISKRIVPAIPALLGFFYMHYDTSLAGSNGSTIRVRTQGRNLSGQLRKLCRDVRTTGAVPTPQHFMALPDRVLEFFIYEPDENKQLKPVYEYRRASPIASQVTDHGQTKLGTAAFSCSKCRCYWGKNDIHCVPYPYGPDPLLAHCPDFEGWVDAELQTGTLPLN